MEEHALKTTTKVSIVFVRKSTRASTAKVRRQNYPDVKSLIMWLFSGIMVVVRLVVFLPAKRAFNFVWTVQCSLFPVNLIAEWLSVYLSKNPSACATATIVKMAGNAWLCIMRSAAFVCQVTQAQRARVSRSMRITHNSLINLCSNAEVAIWLANLLLH